jgi:hypothetical protein
MCFYNVYYIIIILTTKIISMMTSHSHLEGNSQEQYDGKNIILIL